MYRACVPEVFGIAGLRLGALIRSLCSPVQCGPALSTGHLLWSELSFPFSRHGCKIVPAKLLVVEALLFLMQDSSKRVEKVEWNFQ